MYSLQQKMSLLLGLNSDLFSSPSAREDSFL